VMSEPEQGDRRKRTEQKFVLVDDVPNAEVDGSKDDDERLDDAVKQRDNKHKDRLGVDDTVVDHWRGV
jgi:hypothetical protein